MCLAAWCRKITMDAEAVEATLTTAAGYCDSNYWCSIMIDIAKRTVYIYDSMQSSYLRTVRVTYDSDLGVQLDNYNCGVFVLLAFEHFTGAPSVGRMDKKLIMYLRYRYLSLCLH
ncbi:Ulp1 protease family, C-terminal catalytic domain [Phytophthora cactorum]|nr:Ulp1 protease family, C-terminal catalytic domain [Phytophthora cactorum]